MTDVVNLPSEPPAPPPAPVSVAAAPRRQTPIWLWVLTVLILGAVAVVQSPGTPHKKTAEEHEAAIGMRVDPPEGSPLVLLGKLAVFLRQEMSKGTPSMSGNTSMLLQALDDMAGLPHGVGTESRGKDDPEPAAADRLRAAIVAGELAGADEARSRLDALWDELAEASELRGDLDALEVVYSGEGELTDEMREGLLRRHGWFARVALSFDDPVQDPFRKGTAAEAVAIVGFYLAVFMGFILAFLAGLALLVVGLVMAGGGRLRPAFNPAASASAKPTARYWLETFTLFAGSFLALHFAGDGVARLAGKDATWPIWFNLGGQWLLPLTLLWPLARGMSWREYRVEIGWHAPRGVWREIGAGLLAYLAAIPVYVAVAMVVVAILLIQQMLSGAKGPPTPPTKVTDLLTKGGPAVHIVLALLVVVWAPLVEESIFRGALYRHFRSRLIFPLAALMTGMFFALMHAYMPAQLLLIATLGIVFSIMREWRSSLVPSMTAHFVHNSIVLMIVAATLFFMRM